MSKGRDGKQGFSFPKEFRLVKDSEFKRCYSKGKRAKGEFFILVLCRNNREVSRLGLSVPAKFGNAPERNRFKRILREAFRLTRPEMDPGFDMVVVVPKTVKRKLPTLEQARIELKRLFDEAKEKIYKRKK